MPCARARGTRDYDRRIEPTAFEGDGLRAVAPALLRESAGGPGLESGGARGWKAGRVSLGRSRADAGSWERLQGGGSGGY